MKAFILAAGLGSRLGELTKDKPKALVQLNGQALLGRLINYLKGQGFDHFLVNIHHHGQMVVDYLDSNHNFGVQIEISDERSELLDTGGAILKARHFFKGDAPVLIHNVDIISEVNLKKMLSYHLNNNALATLCVRKRDTDRSLIFDDKMVLKGWKNKKTDEYKWVAAPLSNYLSRAYSGIYFADPGFPDHLMHTGKFSIIDGWLSMDEPGRIGGYLDSSENWFDLGTPEKISMATTYLKSQNIG
jgi:NDP-sugar pyrophosphorylase family protein